jgi:glycogen(starch) synthase
MSPVVPGAAAPLRQSARTRQTSIGRVLMTGDAVGGVWRYCIDLAHALRRTGVQTTLAVMGPAPTDAQRREARAAGVHLVEGPYRLEWMPDGLDDLQRSGEWLLEVADVVRPDVVHVNGYAHASLPWPAPVVLVAHSCVRTWWRAVRRENAPPGYDQYTAAVLAGLQGAHTIVAPSQAMLSALVEEYGVPSAGRVIANGCSQVARGSARGTKRPLVLAAGRSWDDAKNVTALCAVAGRIGWPVYLAGATKGPDDITCSWPQLHALGPLSSDTMRAWYARAAIYALPARYEPFGLSVLEAACAGCALVLGDIPSLRENWDGAACFVHPDDHDGLTHTLQRLIDVPGPCRDLARRARQRARAFSLGRMADAYLDVYEGVIA